VPKRWWFTWAGLTALGMTAWLLAACAADVSRGSPTSDAAFRTQVCREAALRAIAREKARYEQWLSQADAEQAARYRAALRTLEALEQALKQATSEAEVLALTARYRPEGNGLAGGSLPATRVVHLDQAWVEDSPPTAVYFEGQPVRDPFTMPRARCRSLFRGSAIA